MLLWCYVALLPAHSVPTPCTPYHSALLNNSLWSPNISTFYHYSFLSFIFNSFYIITALKTHVFSYFAFYLFTVKFT